MTATQQRSGPVKASVRDTMGVVAGVLAPTVARGIIIRRPRVVALAQRLDLDRRAVRRLQRLHEAYGGGPLLLRIPFRKQAVVLDPQDVHRVLQETPEPFTPASSEKRAALDHFEPKGVLVSRGAERTDRRQFNEAVLETDRPVHQLGDRFASVVAQEAVELVGAVGPTGVMGWDDFAPAWMRVVRRVVFGDAARDDEGITDAMAELRAAANWAFLRRQRTGLRQELFDRVEGHVARAEPGSLAEVMARTPTTERTAPVQQVPQWLFAFDAAGMATFRALALVASHPPATDRARAEAMDTAEGVRLELPYLRGCVLESLRLWPTTPAVLRQLTAPTTFDGVELRRGTGFLIYTPYFHRDDRRLPYADRFHPDLWLEERSDLDWPLIPFSAGAGMCPGRNLVLLTTSLVLARLLAHRRVELVGGVTLGPDQPLPGTLDPYGLRFRLS